MQVRYLTYRSGIRRRNADIQAEKDESKVSPILTERFTHA